MVRLQRNAARGHELGEAERSAFQQRAFAAAERTRIEAAKAELQASISLPTHNHACP